MCDDVPWRGGVAGGVFGMSAGCGLSILMSLPLERGVVLVSKVWSYGTCKSKVGSSSSSSRRLASGTCSTTRIGLGLAIFDL